MKIKIKKRWEKIYKKNLGDKIALFLVLEMKFSQKFTNLEFPLKN